MTARFYIWNNGSSFWYASGPPLFLAYPQDFFTLSPTGSLQPARQIDVEWSVCFAGSVLKMGGAPGFLVRATQVRRTGAPSPSRHFS